MDDVLRRLGVVESLTTATREDVSAIKAVLPHLASKADVHAMEARMIRWLIGTTIAATAAAFTAAKFVN